MTIAICRVTLPRPVLQDFAYLVPERLSERIRPGVRVRVPFGPRKEIGLVHAMGETEGDADGGGSAGSGGGGSGGSGGSGGKARRLRPLIDVLDAEPLLDARLLDLCRWISDYYVAPIGLVHRAALPPGMLAARRPAGAPEKTQQVVRLTAELPTLIEREAAFGRARRQQEAFETIEALGGSVAVGHLDTGLGFGRSLVRGLVERGLAEVVEESVERDPFDVDAPVEAPPDTLTNEQTDVLERLRHLIADAHPGAALLRGVTGSGKTVIYTRLIEDVLAAGKSALVLVPEIGLTPQTVARFRAVFGDGIAVLHSGLSAGERHDAWRALRDGRKRVAIGTRSAVFAPLRDLGIIVIDEEHDGSYKQSETPRYHARAVAAVRARGAGALLLLGSATPSLETWHNATEGRYTLLELDRRATTHPLPPVRLIDRRVPGDARGSGGSQEKQDGHAIFSEELREAVRARIESGRQSLLLLNRRGYATVLQCYSCGWIATCRACNVSLTWHRRRARLVCHHCGWEEEVQERCPSCRDPELTFGGVGTEQVERVLGETFPAARIARMDVDTTGGKWAHERILRSVRRSEVDILLGTQMIAKGLDLPGVTLVGVIDADIGLNLPDFRAAERTFQLLSQVAGRAGRGADEGEVLIQTLRPDHPALRFTVTHDFVGFAAVEIADRAGPRYPPHVRLANLVVSGEDETTVADGASELAEWLVAAVSAATDAASLSGAVTVLGPAPCPIDRLRGRWRWHLLLKADAAEDLGSLLRYTAEHSPVAGSNRLEIDRDPESLL